MDRPKRPPSAFMHFSFKKKQDIIQEHPELKFVEIAKILGTMWKNMSDDEKNVYIMLQEEGKQAYEQAVAAYNQSNMNGIIRTRNNQGGNNDDSDDYDAC